MTAHPDGVPLSCDGDARSPAEPIGAAGRGDPSAGCRGSRRIRAAVGASDDLECRPGLAGRPAGNARRGCSWTAGSSTRRRARSPSGRGLRRRQEDRRVPRRSRSRGKDADSAGERRLAGEIISTSFVESAVNQVISKRMVKKQQMRWSPRGAHLLLQIRTRVLNDTLAYDYRRWYRDFTHTPTGRTKPRSLPRFVPLSCPRGARRSTPLTTPSQLGGTTRPPGGDPDGMWQREE